MFTSTAAKMFSGLFLLAVVLFAGCQQGTPIDYEAIDADTDFTYVLRKRNGNEYYLYTYRDGNPSEEIGPFFLGKNNEYAMSSKGVGNARASKNRIALDKDNRWFYYSVYLKKKFGPIDMSEIDSASQQK